mmetsp:Transcript_41087/g.74080  ORF Transcript_41087/g.74080 Transcript_41087/m.74080 type:complete len:81 (+) Transcript_41087:241-483(+)
MLTLGAEFKRSETMLLQRRGQKVFPRENTSEICKKSLKITPAQESISEPPASIPPQLEDRSGENERSKIYLRQNTFNRLF